MSWIATWRNGCSVAEDNTPLSHVLAQAENVARFAYVDPCGKVRLAMAIPFQCKLVVFKRQYVSTNGDKSTVYVMGWSDKAGGYTLAFIQPYGLVEISADKEYITTFEKSLSMEQQPCQQQLA